MSSCEAHAFTQAYKWLPIWEPKWTSYAALANASTAKCRSCGQRVTQRGQQLDIGKPKAPARFRTRAYDLRQSWGE